jgi:cysteine desulfurase
METVEKSEIYFDNAATTKINAEVLRTMTAAEERYFYNSSALYRGAAAAAEMIADAKKIIKRKLGGENGDLHFMSGATEANNTVIFGKIKNPRHRLVVVRGEHSSVHSPAVHLEQAGFPVSYAPLLPAGEIDINAAADLITKDTALFVFGLVNSDIGTLQNAAETVKRIRAKNPKTHIHCDAVQGFCKYDFNVEKLGFDSVTVSAHKIYGPKGIGALWIRRGVPLPPLIYGGRQCLRAGTESPALILGFARAVEIFDTAANFAHITKLHKRLTDGLPHGVTVNGVNNNPYITSISLPDIYGETVLNALNEKNIFVGLGSACASGSGENRTLQAMGRNQRQQKQVLRISFGVSNTVGEVDIFLTELKQILTQY